VTRDWSFFVTVLTDTRPRTEIGSSEVTSGEASDCHVSKLGRKPFPSRNQEFSDVTEHRGPRLDVFLGSLFVDWRRSL
jgi:hypothetical protein